MNKDLKRLSALLTGLVTVFSTVGGYTPSEKRSAANSVSAASGNIIAFPGAVGGGKFATGGRGGEVYHVTNLNDSGTGSLRDAVSKSNRIVVFDVSGTIELKSNIICQSNITVAGQTAPGGSGVTLKNYKFGMSGDNIIVRYVSSRPGPYASTSSGNDAWGGAKGSNSIIDHCSMGWTTDEQWGLYSNNENYTVQYSVLGPADSWGGHKKGLHGFGIMMGKGNLTFDHNLIIHNVSRNFRGKVVGTATADFTNNIIYDWGYQTAYGTIGHLNYVNNYLKAGKSTTGGYHWMYVDSGTSPQNFKVYCSGNKMINKDGSTHAINNDNWSGVTLKTAIGITKDDLYSASPFATNINGENVSTATTCENADAAYDHVIDFAGNGISSDKRTAIDQQCAYETRTGTGSCSGTAEYDSTKTDLDKYSIQCGVTYEYPAAVLKKEIVDNDNDGMDDNWELARGLDPNDPTDINGDYCGKGYTNIEYYINDLTVDSFPEGVVELSPETAVEPISAFETIEAESFSLQEGVRTEDLSAGGQNIGFIENGDWVMYRNVDFADGAKTFSAKLSGNAANIEIYTDSLDGTPAAKIAFKGTGSFGSYQDCTFNIPSITGTHDFYLKFTGGDGYLLNMDSFVFGKETLSLNGKLFTNVSVSDTAIPSSWDIGSNAQVGSAIFGDRTFTISSINPALSGAEILMTACDAKGTTGDTAVFTAGQDIDLYVCLDSRVSETPAWLANYEKMCSKTENFDASSDIIFTTSNSLTFIPYKLSLKSGDKVTLGSNGQSYQCVNFTVLALPAAPPAETTTTTTATTTTTTTTTTLTTPPTTETVINYGDSNEDGKVDISDAVLVLQAIANSDKYGVNGFDPSHITEQGFINADCNKSRDGVTTADALSIQKYVVELITLPVE